MKYKRACNQLSLTWLQRDVTIDVLQRFAVQFGISADPRSIVSAPMPDPSGFSCPESFRAAYWQAEVWSKFPFDIGIDREREALATFRECEHSCADSNRRLVDLWSRPIPEGMRRVLGRARRLMEHLFAGFTPDEVVQHCSWGPGASTSKTRAQATPANKWVFGAHITEDALPWFYAFSQWSGRVFPRPTIVSGNKVVTVPKNAKTDRTIAIEPDWNCFFQLGLGGAIRRRLQRRFGLLQAHAQDVNKILAREGSRTGSLATIDLKGASDSVSLALVEALAPAPLLRAIMSLRSPRGSLGDGSTVLYEKVSSMGCGFTFELETALFYCLVRAASGYATVYGDDIIVSASAYQQAVDVLTFCGFTVNSKKSFSSGPFRESCGGHYFDGVDVTPPYVRRPLRGPTRLAFANRISALTDNGHWRSSLGQPMWDATTRGIPSYLDGPSYVDGVLHVDVPRRIRRKKSLFCYTGPRLIENLPIRRADPVGSLLQWLWCRSASDDRPVETAWEKSSSRTVVRYGQWVGHWQGVSPWSGLTA